MEVVDVDQQRDGADSPAKKATVADKEVDSDAEGAKSLGANTSDDLPQKEEQSSEESSSTEKRRPLKCKFHILFSYTKKYGFTSHIR